jgi:hypothetical protein
VIAFHFYLYVLLATIFFLTSDIKGGRTGSL